MIPRKLFAWIFFNLSYPSNCEFYAKIFGVLVSSFSSQSEHRQIPRESWAKSIDCWLKYGKELYILEISMGETFADLTIERELAEQLGIEAIDHQEVILANGKSDVVGVGSAEVVILGIRRVVPLFIYDSNLIGLTTLEAAGLRVNPVTTQLERVPGRLLGIKAKHMPN
jgi:predicted aspartyl protease